MDNDQIQGNPSVQGGNPEPETPEHPCRSQSRLSPLYKKKDTGIQSHRGRNPQRTHPTAGTSSLQRVSLHHEMSDETANQG